MRDRKIADNPREFESPRAFQVVFVQENHGVGILPEGKPDKTVHYSGKQINVTP
jgi:hypothetical protein